MKIHDDIAGLCPCYNCGSDDVLFLSNAVNRFQVRCGACGTRTRWKRKQEAIIDWFNAYISSKKNANRR